jgi:hypothetical protein
MVYGEEDVESALNRLAEEGQMSPFTELKSYLIEIMAIHPRLEESWDYGMPWLIVSKNQK